MNSKLMRAEEVASELDISVSFAYKIIKQLNDELKASGYITISGRVNRQYFNERLYGTRKEGLKDAGIQGQEKPYLVCNGQI